MRWNSNDLSIDELSILLSDADLVNHDQRWNKPERRSGKRIIAGTAFHLEFQVR